jgi:hypothetical protein
MNGELYLHDVEYVVIGLSEHVASVPADEWFAMEHDPIVSVPLEYVEDLILG